MARPHPVHVITLILAGLAVVFSFLALSAASEARDQAATAAALAGTGDPSGVHELQQALIRSGVIEDPAVIPDDHRQPGGPWGRCLTEAERRDLEGDAADREVDVDEPEVGDCGTARVEAIVCPDAPPDTQPAVGDEPGELDCAVAYRIDGEPFVVSDRVRPDDLEASATTVLNVEDAAEVDRVALGVDGERYVHVLDGGEGGLEAGWWYVFPES